MACKTIKTLPFNDRAFVGAALAAFMFGASICGEPRHAQGATEPIWPTKEWQTSSPEEQGMDSKELAKLVDFGTTSSFDSLLVVRHGKIVAEAYYAPYAAGIPHAVYSAVKTVISALMEIAFKDGLLDSPNHRVLDYFDRRSIANVDDRKEAITVQNLLDMTSGIEWTMPDSMFEMERSPDWVKFVLDRRMSSAPGNVFNYSNGNAHLLSAILTKLTGMSALEYAKAKLFGALGINDPLWEHDPQGISNGGKGLYLESRDMAKIGYLYLRKGVWERKQLLPADWIDKVTHATIDPHVPGEPALRYSDLFWVLPEKHVCTAAGYHGQLIMVFPELDVVAVTTGRDNYPLSKLADYIFTSVKSDTALASDAASAKLLANKVIDVSTEKRTEVGSTPELAAIISGKVYRFPPNAIKVKSLSLILTDPLPRYDVEMYADDATESGRRLNGPIGLDGLYRKGEPTCPEALAIRRVNAVKGTWQDDHIFVVDRLVLGEGQPGEEWRLTFDGEKLKVRAKLVDGSEISIDGETSG
jgi:CubicO group peptidase (beta-lactamase class C family)